MQNQNTTPPAGTTPACTSKGALNATHATANAPVAATAACSSHSTTHAPSSSGSPSHTKSPDVSREMQYWKENYSSRPYARAPATYDDFAPAYRLGWESCSRRTAPDQTFESVEPTLSREWEKVKGKSVLVWEQAKEACRDAWTRIQQAAKVVVAPVTSGS